MRRPQRMMMLTGKQ